MSEPPPITFRAFAAAGEPAAGELWVQAAAEHGDCRALALLALDHGAGAFRRGGADVARLVVGHDPTFDDLLAAHLLQALPAGRPAADSEKYRPFARYAALVREGLRPATVPVESSIEGVFLFLRSEAGASLADAAAAQSFLAGWARMAARIDAAAAAGLDPFAASPFADDPEFATARAHLLRDRALYGHDVHDGRRFTARIPGGPANCGALLLRSPKSRLFRYWAREDPDAPGGHGHLLLLVNWGDGRWVISTDPVARVSLRPLYERLQALEPRPADGGPAGQWFDGAPFRHTLIAAPHGGTRLPEKAVLRAVRDWCRLKAYAPTGGGATRQDFTAAVVARWQRNLIGIALTTMAAWFVGWLSRPPAPPAAPPAFEQSGKLKPVPKVGSGG